MRRAASSLFAFLLAVPTFAAVTGTVMNGDGQPVVGAKISVYAPETIEARRLRIASATPQRNALTTASTGNDGSFRAEVPKEQSFVELRVDAAGYAPESSWSAANDEAGAIVLTRAVAKTGTITANGKPVAHATVYWTGGTAADVVAVTDANGKYSVPDPSKWANRLVVIHPDYAAFSETMLRDPSRLSPDRALNAGVKISGRVVAEDGTTAVGGADVYIDHWPAGKTADDGTFTIAHAKKDWQDVEARAGARAAHRAHTDGAVTMKLAKAATLSGTVVDSKTQQPVAGAYVTLMSGGFNMGGSEILHSAISDAKGAFTIANILPGTFGVMSDRPGYNLPRVEVALVAGRTVQKPLYAMPLGTITGTVVDEDKRPVAAAHVTTRAASREAMNLTMMFGRPGARGVYSGPDGRFVARDVQTEHDVIVDAAKKGYPSAHTASMRVHPGEKKSGITLTIPRGIAFAGRVLDKNNKPVANAAVELNESTNDPGGQFRRIMAFANNRQNDDQVRSGGDGTFVVRVKEGRYDVVVKAEGFASKTLRAQQVAAGMKPVDIVVEPGVEITGRVTRGGAGVDGVNIATMSMTEGMQSTMTGPDGSFRLTDLSPGSMMLIANKQEAFIQEMRQVTAPARDVNIELPPGGRITGHVVDKATHQPVSSFQAGVSTSRGGGGMVIQTPPMLKAFTNDDGAFTLDNVRPGPTQVVVNAPGYTAGRVPNIEVEEGKTAPEVTVELETGVKLTGKVTGQSGEPLSGVTVSPEQTSRGGRVMRFDTMGSTVVTDPQGEYTIEALEPGEKSFSYSLSGYVTETRSVNLTGKEVRSDVQLSSGLRVSGMVVTDGGAPVGDALVRATSASDNMFGREAHSDAGGNFLFEGLAPGHYTFNAAKSGYANGVARDVDVSTGAPVRVTMKSGGTITGHVSGLTAEELQQANVMASGAGTGSSSAPVDAGGNYRIEGAPTGTVRVVARVGGPFGGGGKSSEPKTVVLDAGGSATADIEFQSDTVVRGHITRGGQPLHNAMVLFFPKAGKAQTNASTTADGSGNYQISGLADGTYNVQVIDFERTAPFTTSYEVKGSGTFDIDIRVSTVRGRVVDATNQQPLADARVEIRATGTDTPFASRAAMTDAGGNFILDTVARGSYEINASKDGFGHSLKDIDVQDAPADVELKLSPSAGVTLRVVDGRDGRLLAATPHVMDMQGRTIDSGFSFNPNPQELTLDLAPGAYRVTLYATGYAIKTVTVSSPSPAQNVPMTPGGTLFVKSKSSSGNLRIRLIDGSGLPYARLGLNAGTYPLLAAPGVTTLQNVAPGTFRLEVLDQTDRVVNSTSVTVNEGLPTTIEI
ncbi:MAG TPA: carboxypeptidase regulatory-like domain-containing protein [Thermoanaerobaculia bacterium]|nr:carboxypeptidase regulatory-like domain-containing protein [Thermoanaerobaculia bacterium]